MVRPWKFRVLLSLLTVQTLAGCDVLGFHDWEWHQKLTVVVNTPMGPVTGVSVAAIELSLSPTWFGIGDFRGAGGSSLSGEAVVVEVAPDQYLFVLLEGYNHETAMKTFAQTRKPIGREASISAFNRLEAMRETRELPPNLYPMMVTFANAADPSTVIEVLPGNFSKYFGPGVTLSSISLSITEEPLTIGNVENTLPWIYRKELRENPTWASLPNIVQTTIHGLVR